MPSNISKRQTLTLAFLSIIPILIFSSYLLFGKESLTYHYGKVVDSAKTLTGWSQSVMCEDGQSVDRLHNRMACDYCAEDDVFCHSIGEHNIARSIAYEGSNSRIHRFLRKLRNGQPVTISAIGGSVSAGHGLYLSGFERERDGPGNLHWRIYNWITEQYPHPDHKFVNGAVAGSGTDYFSACFGEHIPEDSDLVILEFAINDQRGTNAQDSYERLIRALLDLESKPAIINLHVFALRFNTIVQGGSEHLGIAQYYDTPVVTLRNLALPIIFKKPEAVADWFFNDPAAVEGPIDLRHLSPYGHQVAANITASYFLRQMCKMEEMERLSGLDVNLKDAQPPFQQWADLDKLPKQLLTSHYDPEAKPIPPLRPNCFSTMSERHPLKQETDEGWFDWNWKEKKYLIGREVGANVQVKFDTILGSVTVFYLKSGKYGLGMATCWVDGDRHREVPIDGYWDETASIPFSQVIRDDLEPGEHILHCEILGETRDPGGGHEFRLTSVTSL